jgi:uncharacterized Tic20 family protein
MNTVTGEQKILAIVSHIGYFLGGVGLVIVPLIIFLIKKDDYFVYDHAKQAMIAQLVIFVAGAVVGLLSMILVGFLLMPLLALGGIILFVTSIIASIKAFDGEYYRYPFIQKIVDAF